MELLEGRKYRKRRTEKSIMDIKVNDSYTIYVFKGSLSPKTWDEILGLIGFYIMNIFIEKRLLFAST